MLKDGKQVRNGGIQNLIFGYLWLSVLGQRYAMQ